MRCLSGYCFMPFAEGTLSQHMAAHIVAMYLVAPCLALGIERARGVTLGSAPHLAGATFAQIVLLWGWHIPALVGLAAINPVVMLAMHLSLFAVALWFWAVVVALVRQQDWKPIAALLVTGKLFCLLGVLLTFAPRALYWQFALIQSCFGLTSASPLEDQQLAGLMMLVACPLVFVGSAIVAAQRWLAGPGARDGWRPRLEAA